MARKRRKKNKDISEEKVNIAKEEKKVEPKVGIEPAYKEVVEEKKIESPKEEEKKKEPIKEPSKDETLTKDDRKGLTAFFVMFLLVLVVFIILLPNFNRKDDTYNYDYDYPFESAKESSDESIESTMSVSDYFQANIPTETVFNDIKVGNVVYDGTKLTMDVVADKRFSLDSKDYYIEFYQNKNKFIARRLMMGDTNSNITIDTTGINIDTNTYMTISHIDRSTIPSMKVNADNDGNSILVCNKDNYEYDYNFKDQKLLKTAVKETTTSDDLNALATLKMNKQKEANTYNSAKGLTADIVDGQNSFVFMLEIDLSKVGDTTAIKYDNIYTKDEKENVIKFLMEAKGYSCHE